MERVEIAVHPSAASLHADVRAVLTRLTPVQFVDCPDLSRVADGQAVLNLSAQSAALAALANHPVPRRCFHVTHLRQGVRSESEGEPVRFADHIQVERPLRGRSIPHWALAELPPV